MDDDQEREGRKNKKPDDDQEREGRKNKKRKLIGSEGGKHGNKKQATRVYSFQDLMSPTAPSAPPNAGTPPPPPSSSSRRSANLNKLSHYWNCGHTRSSMDVFRDAMHRLPSAREDAGQQVNQGTAQNDGVAGSLEDTHVSEERRRTLDGDKDDSKETKDHD